MFTLFKYINHSIHSKPPPNRFWACPEAGRVFRSNLFAQGSKKDFHYTPSRTIQSASKGSLSASFQANSPSHNPQTNPFYTYFFNPDTTKKSFCTSFLNTTTKRNSFCSSFLNTSTKRNSFYPLYSITTTKRNSFCPFFSISATT